MHKTRRSARAIGCLGLLVGCGVLAAALGCRGSATGPPDPAPAAGGEQGGGEQAGQSSEPGGRGPSAGASSGAADTERAGPRALDGSGEGPAAGLPLIITFDLPEVPEKIRNPTPMPDG